MELRFTIGGKWFTDFVRQRFLYEGMTYDWVVETLKSTFVGVDDERANRIAQDIILGSSHFEGDSTSGLTYCDGSDELASPDFFKKYSELRASLEKEREARKEAQEAWQELVLVIAGEMSKSDCECKVNLDLLAPTPIEEFIDRMIAPEDEVPPYGFFSPDGEFHAVDYAEHEEYAREYIRAHEGWGAVVESRYFSGTDYLVNFKGWLLLHNPRQGKPILTMGDKPMTKAQRAALFDYYIKYGMKTEANALYTEV